MNKLLLLFCLIFFTCLTSSADIVEDDIALKLSKIQEPSKTYLNYNYESTVKVPITLKIIEPILSETDLYEGQILDFKIAKDVHYNDNVIFKRGDKVQAKIGVIISPGMNGIPASIILKDFQTEKNIKGQLSSTYEIFGQDRSLWVFPLKWALTPLPPAGSLTNFICGGHAKLKTKKIITIYYYPEWK